MPRLSLEPFDPHLHRGSAAATGLLVGSSALLVTTTGDAFMAAVLVGIAVADALAGAVAVAAVLGALARFGTSSLAGLAGAQAVLGPAMAVDPAVGAAGSALSALACIAVAPKGWRGIPLGLLAGVVAIGPSATAPVDALLRATGVLAGVAAVLLLPRPPRIAAPIAAAVGLALAVVA